MRDHEEGEEEVKVEPEDGSRAGKVMKAGWRRNQGREKQLVGEDTCRDLGMKEEEEVVDEEAVAMEEQKEVKLNQMAETNTKAEKHHHQTEARRIRKEARRHVKHGK